MPGLIVYIARVFKTCFHFPPVSRTCGDRRVTFTRSSKLSSFWPGSPTSWGGWANGEQLCNDVIQIGHLWMNMRSSRFLRICVRVWMSVSLPMKSHEGGIVRAHTMIGRVQSFVFFSNTLSANLTRLHESQKQELPSPKDNKKGRNLDNSIFCQVLTFM